MREGTVRPGQTGKIRKPLNLLYSLRRHLVLALVISAVGSACAVFAAHIKTTTTFTAEAVLNVEPSVPKILHRTEDTMMLRSYEDWMRTQVNIIESYPILKEAIESHHNAGHVWRRPGESERTAVARLNAKLKVAQMRDTQLIRVSMSSSNKKGLAEIVNSVVQTFMNSKKRQQEDEDTVKLKRLNQEKEKVQNQLDASYHELERVSNLLGTAVTEEKNLYVYIDSLYDLKQSQNKLFLERIDLANKLESLRKKTKTVETMDIDPLVNEIVERNALLQDNLIQRNRKEQEMRDLMVDLSEENPQYRHQQNRMAKLHEQTERLGKTISEREKRILREKMLAENRMDIMNLSADYEAVLKTEEQVEQKMKELQKDILERNTAVLRASTSRQEIERLQSSLNRINERIDQITLEWANPGRIHVMELAIPPEDGVGNKMKLLIAGVFGSFVFGFGLAVGLDILDPTIRRPDEIRKGLGFPPTGFVIDSKEDGIDPEQIHFVFKKHFSSFIHDQYSKIAIHFDKERKAHGSSVFMFLSPKSGYGATSQAINVLASMDAPLDRKLYLDLNYRNPVENSLPFLAGKEGISDWSGQTGEIDPYIRTEPRLPFRVLALGTVKELFPPVLALSRVSELLGALRPRFDCIFIDAPPLLTSNYSEGLAALSDVTVLVVEAGRTHWGEIAHAVNLLDRIGTQVVSIVLNRVRILKEGYYKEAMEQFYGKRALEKDGFSIRKFGGLFRLRKERDG